MKKILLLVVVIALSVTTSFSQKGEKAIGLNFGYLTTGQSVFVGAHFQYNILDALRVEPSFNYHLPKEGMSAFEINANGHYLFPVAPEFTVYPLAGLHYLNAGEGASLFGLNLGGGANYNLTEKLRLGIEMKYTIIEGFSMFVPSVGLSFKF